MDSIKCHQCGLVSWPDSESNSCKRCGSPVWQKNDYGAGFTFDGKRDETALFSGIIRFLTFALGAAVLVLIALRALNLGGTDIAKFIGLPIAVLGFGIMAAMGIWFLARVFGESVGWGLAVLFLPFGGLVALIKFWDRTHRPFIGHLLCVGIAFSGIFICT